MELTQLLPDPINNRVVKSLKPPPHRPIKTNLLFKTSHTIDCEYLKEFLKCEGTLAKKDFMRLIQIAKEVVQKQPNLIKINDPIVIVGDIHGQYYDLIKIFEVGGKPQDINYLFLGDYVDRGSFSIEVLQLLFSLKITFPNSVFLLRGNHECRQMTSFFNFRTECLHKYDQQVYNEIMLLFDLLPISAIVNNKFFCIHGGLSPELNIIDDIDLIDRVQQTPKNGVLCDFMWADPIQKQSGVLGKLVEQNEVRGCSYLFGKELTNKFNSKNKIISVIRAHQAQNEGYRFYKWNHKDEFPPIVTVFSAPNYCDVYNNKAAVIVIKKGLFDVKQFSYSDHPYFLPNFMDIFTWSLPFVAQKISHMFSHLLKPQKNSRNEDEDIDNATKLLEELYEIQHAEKMANENLMRLNGRLPDDKLLRSGMALAESDDDQDVFDTNKGVDQRNEKRPNL